MIAVTTLLWKKARGKSSAVAIRQHWQLLGQPVMSRYVGAHCIFTFVTPEWWCCYLAEEVTHHHHCTNHSKYTAQPQCSLNDHTKLPDWHGRTQNEHHNRNDFMGRIVYLQYCCHDFRTEKQWHKTRQSDGGGVHFGAMGNLDWRCYRKIKTRECRLTKLFWIIYIVKTYLN